MIRTRAAQALFQAMDTEWRTAKELADRADVERRTAGQRCMMLVRQGVAEFRQVGEAASPHSDPPPREYRRLW